MNLLIIAKLSREKLLSKLQPFIDNPQVDHIFILRDKEFVVGSDKISFIPVPKYKGVFRHIEKIGIAWRFSKSHQVNIIISYLLPPHGYIAFIVSKLTKIPWIHAVIAGHREIWMNGQLLKWLNLKILRNASIVDVMGNATYHYLTSNGINAEKVTIIPNAIDNRRFKMVTNRTIKYDILYAGRIDENKNVPLLIKAIDRISSSFPELKVCVAGDGDKLKSIIDLVKSKGLQSFFTFLGAVDHDNIKGLYETSKIFVLTSRGEGVPMALLEAMFCGLACVSTNVGEIGSIIVDGKNGYLLSNPDDDNRLSEILATLLKDTVRCQKVGREAALISDTYSYENVTKLWKQTFNRLLDDERASC